jgi:hypothetical protein
MVLTQITNRACNDSLTLTYPPNISVWLVLQFWYPRVEFFDTTINIDYWHHAFTYIPVQHWHAHNVRRRCLKPSLPLASPLFPLRRWEVGGISLFESTWTTLHYALPPPEAHPPSLPSTTRPGWVVHITCHFFSHILVEFWHLKTRALR